ncbi:MAG: nucleoside triphosphate pyrophosphohydrolase [Bacteroidales bacterium]|nr:nucleoside triphosphate pyrophosphohydrolase [Bacteroidales bacterium]
MASKTCTAFERLRDILDTLRSQCPWDREQTMQSLRYLTIEEAHELSEAIVADSPDDIRKELGDLAMHVLFYCKIAEEKGLFTTDDVYNTVCDKLVARHPFIYNPDAYHGESWEQLKMRERGRKGVLDGVPRSLPSLVMAQRMQEKVSGMGVQPTSGDVPPLREGMDAAEFGDMLFALVDWGRRHGIGADDALAAANHRFRQSAEAANSKQ